MPAACKRFVEWGLELIGNDGGIMTPVEATLFQSEERANVG